MNTVREQFNRRIRKLTEERLYVREGWHVPVRTVEIPQPTPSPKPRRHRRRLPLIEWLMYPLINSRV